MFASRSTETGIIPRETAWKARGEGVNELEEAETPLLSKEGKAREARWGGSKIATYRHGNHPLRDREAIPLPS